MCDDPNIINCLQRLGFLYDAAFYAGFLGLFIGPCLVWGAFSKSKNGEPRFSESSPALVVLFRFSAGLTAASLALAVFFAFPGILFCSVFCFLGIGLPAVGASSSIAAVFFMLLLGGNKQDPVEPPKTSIPTPQDSKEMKTALIFITVLVSIVGLVTAMMLAR